MKASTATVGPAENHAAAELRVERNANSTAWNDYLHRRLTESLWQQCAWDKIFAVYRLTTFRLTALEGQQIVGVLPLVWQRSKIFGNRLVSLPWFDTAGILADHEEAASALLNDALRLARECGAGELQLRQGGPVPGWPAPRTDKVLMRLPLESDPDALWGKLGPKVRNQVRKAEKESLTCDCGGAELLSDFYQVYSVNMRDLGSPAHNRTFFRTVLSSFTDGSRIHVVRLSGQAIGAGLTLGNGSTLEIPWASSLRRYNPLCVNHLLYWNILRQACLDGYRMFHFGRSTIDQGTYRFKKQWGAEAVPLVWYTFRSDGTALAADHRPEESFSLGRRVWQRLPVWLTCRLGPRIIRHVA